MAKDEQSAEAMQNDIAKLKKDALDILQRNVHNMNEPGKKIIYAAIGGVIVYGMMNVSGYLSKEARTSITNASGLVINNSAINLNITPAKLHEIADPVKLTTAGQFFADVDVDIAIDLDGVEKPKKAHLIRITK